MKSLSFYWKSNNVFAYEVLPNLKNGKIKILQDILYNTGNIVNILL